MTRNCPRCGRYREDWWQWCPWCGAVLPSGTFSPYRYGPFRITIAVMATRSPIWPRLPIRFKESLGYARAAIPAPAALRLLPPVVSRRGYL